MTLRWRVATVEEAPAADLSGLLSPREQGVLAGLTFPARRNKWLAGRLAAKRLLIEELRESGTPTPPPQISILNEPSGAPCAEIEGRGRWQGSLSISHRGDRGLAALTTDPGVTVGADIETVEPRDPALVRQFFTVAEAERVERAGEAGAHEVARVWSAKEAVSKALGLGLRLDTQEIEVGKAEGAADNAGWRSIDVALTGRAVAAAAAGRPLRVIWRDLDDCVVTVALLG